MEGGAAPEFGKAVDRRELVDQPGGEHEPPCCHAVGAAQLQPEAPLGEGVRVVHGGLVELDAWVAGELLAPDPPQLCWRGAVVGQQVVDRGRRGVAALPGIEQEHAAPATAEGQRGGQSSWAAADDDGVVHGPPFERGREALSGRVIRPSR